LAYLSDTETALGNTFVAGTIDLKVDNESYYNGAISEGTTFGPSDLGDGKLFINFTDLKPDDEGEDTISLTVNDNDAWLCMDMALTSDDDKSSNEPELLTGDPMEDSNNTWDGELGNLVEMVWWVDDGDNVLEQGENLLSDGVQNIQDLFGQDKIFSADLADSTTNVWTGEPGPAIGSQTYHIGKAWCYGNMTLSPLAQDDYDNPIGEQGPGWTCDGRALDNASQTDGVTINIAFRAMQARNYPNYTCGEEKRLAIVTVTKQVVNDNNGNNVVADYQLYIDDGVNTFPVTSGVPAVVPVGNYTVTETGIPGYAASFSGPDCDSVGQLTLIEGDNKACTIVNNDLPSNITLFKNVVSGGASPTLFGLRLDGGLVQHNSSVAVNSNTPHTISEDGRAGYTFTSITGISSYGKPCPTALGGSITLDEGETIVCTITNTAIPIP
jgi:hypothetical protein